MSWFRKPTKRPDIEQRIALAIQSLPEELQAVVLLRRSEGLSVPQSAERLGPTEQEAWYRLARAMLLITLHLGVRSVVPTCPTLHQLPQGKRGGRQVIL